MIGSISDDPALAQFGFANTSSDSREAGELGQEEFLRLMITQLKNQDPTKPLESGEFLGQLAQFGTVSGLADLKVSFEQLAGSLVSNQAMQAAGLVGRSVVARSEVGYLEAGGTLSGAVDVPVASGDVRVRIVDESGQLIDEVVLGQQPSGFASFTWNGMTSDGEVAPAGTYELIGSYLGDGEMEQAETLIDSTVESVSVRPTGIGVQLRGLGEFHFSSIEEIG